MPQEAPGAPRRRFNGNERVALYLAADGHCSRCGVALAAGWHGDHITPYSAGGPTDILNGQALCPECNLKKGTTVADGLRDWQNHARDLFLSQPKRDFMVAATPGAGKTWFSLALAKLLIDEGTAERIVVVVPTDALRSQWADEAGKVGISLMPVSCPDDYEKTGYHGCVVTYAQAARGVGAQLLRRVTRRPTIAILDEIHHAGESRAWGDGLTDALEHAIHRIALTGTPWRKDSTSPIPFVTYDANGKVKVDYAYEYGTAVSDGVCRRIEFHAYDGEAKWADCGKVSSSALGSNLAEIDVSAVLDTVLQPNQPWMPALLAQADKALDDLRTEVPDAGGLVVAHEMYHARAYAEILKHVTGQEPTIVLSDDPDAKGHIERFRDGTSKWLVAVRMVSEGVDIKRLAVGVYATKIRTPLFFRQVVGRFVRVRKDEEFNARLYIPAVPTLMDHAREIEEELRHQLAVEFEREQKAREDAGYGQGAFEFERHPLSATEATFDRAILNGDEVTPEEVDRAVAWCRSNGIPATYATNVARGHRSMEQDGVDVISPEAVPVVAIPRHRRERMLRGEVDTLAGKVAYRMGMPKKDFNYWLRKEGFPPRAKATIEDLERMETFLAKKLGES
ncbi:DEAD/DEAH box helicase family protein [Streptomyces sp. NPDC005786]|uniref:DEAD/DEAH box helicase family protein n=1 Tax=Streptomyces sp. NPDC005786 TaxID=3154891 RepID=UPI0033CA8E03